jgi:hypothetical protein
VVLVVRCRLAGDRIFAPDAVIRLSTAAALGEVTEGLSDLQLDASGDGFLLLTSHESAQTTPEGHSGHLFGVPAGVLLGAAPSTPVPLAAPLRRFRAKPEGPAAEPSAPGRRLRRRPRVEAPLRGVRAGDGLFAVIDAKLPFAGASAIVVSH